MNIFEIDKIFILTLRQPTLWHLTFECTPTLLKWFHRQEKVFRDSHQIWLPMTFSANKRWYENSVFSKKKLTFKKLRIQLPQKQYSIWTNTRLNISRINLPKMLILQSCRKVLENTGSNPSLSFVLYWNYLENC